MDSLTQTSIRSWTWGAERARFRKDFAGGFPALSSEWFNLLASLSGQPTGRGLDPVAALPENPRLRASATAVLLRSRPAAELPKDEFGPGIKHALDHWRSWQSVAVPTEPPVRWETWLQYAKRVDYLRNAGTAGTGDEELNTVLNRFMERHHAPAAARDVVSFRHGMASWNFAKAAAGERLMPLATNKRGWIPADELRDGLVFARLHLRDIQGARQALDSLARFSKRPSTVNGREDR